MRHAIQHMLKRFGREEKGSVAIETVILVPMLFWAYLSMFAVFDSYRQHAMTQKAAYTIGDMVSRETNPIDNAYLKGMQEMLQLFTNAPDLTSVALRISTIYWDEADGIFKKDWSEVKGGFITPLSDSEVEALDPMLPVIPDKERMTIVETFVQYDPPFDTGLKERTIRNFVFTRPRYAPQILFAD